jgi:hypothetical protein
MNLLPVIERELTVHSRQASTHWLRCAVGAAAVMLAVQEVGNAPAGMAGAGRAAFSSILMLGVFLSMACGLMMGDNLSRERREGTLGLLFLTRLKGSEVVLGKFFSSGLHAFYALVAFLPALSIVILAGGVGMDDLGRSALCLIDDLLVFLAIGLWVSSRNQERGKALRRTAGVIVVLCVIPLVLANNPRWDFLAYLSPLKPILLVPHASYVTAPGAYWFSLAIVQVEGWVFLLATAKYLNNRSALEVTYKKPPPEWTPVDQQQTETLINARVAMLHNDPICWMVTRLRIQSGLLIGAGVFLLIGIASGPLLFFVLPGMARGLWRGLHLVLTVGSGALVAWGSGRFLFEAKRGDALELLLTTPMGAQDIIRGNWRAILRSLFGLWLPVGIVCVLSFTAGMSGYFRVFQSLVSPVTCILDLLALCWLGMYFGLKSKNPFGVVAWTVGLVIVAPYLIILLIWSGLSVGSIVNARMTFRAVWLVLWPCLIAAKSIFFIVWASRHLRSELRTEAAVLRKADWMA